MNERGRENRKADLRGHELNGKRTSQHQRRRLRRWCNCSRCQPTPSARRNPQRLDAALLLPPVRARGGGIRRPDGLTSGWPTVKSQTHESINTESEGEFHTSTAYQFFMNVLRATCDIFVGAKARYVWCMGEKRSERVD